MFYILGTGFTCLWKGRAGQEDFVPRCRGMEANTGGQRGTYTWWLFPGCLGMAAFSSSTEEGSWVQNLAVRALCIGNGYQGSGRRYPEHPLVRLVLSVSRHVGEAGKATSPQGHGPRQPRCHSRSLRLCHGWMQGGDGGFGLGGSPAPARQDARLPRTVPLECRHRRAELQRRQLHVFRQVCGHQPAPGPLTACFQLQPEQGSVPPHHTTPAPALPCSRELRAPAPRSHPGHLLAAAAPLTTSPSLSSVLHHYTSTFKHL